MPGTWHTYSNRLFRTLFDLPLCRTSPAAVLHLLGVINIRRNPCSQLKVNALTVARLRHFGTRRRASRWLYKAVRCPTATFGPRAAQQLGVSALAVQRLRSHGSILTHEQHSELTAVTLKCKGTLRMSNFQQVLKLATLLGAQTFRNTQPTVKETRNRTCSRSLG